MARPGVPPWMTGPGWRALGVFWLVVGLAFAIGTGWLAHLGPPEAPPPLAAALSEPPAAATGPEPPRAAEAPPQAASARPEPAEAPATPPRPAESAGPAAARPAEPTAALPVPAPAGPGAVPGTPEPGTAPSGPGAADPALPPRATPGPTPDRAEAPPAPEPPPLGAERARSAEPDRAIPPPDPALLEPSRHGALPRVGADGRTPIRAYGRPFDRGDTRPRVAVVVADIGLGAALTEEAVRRLPPAIGLALSPYAPRLQAVAERARERGMETLVSIPMEPTGYPLNDPGDRALLTGRPAAENLDNLDWALGRFAGYVGAIGALGGMRGERAAAMPELFAAVQDVLRGRGLLYVDPRPGAPPPPRAWGRSVDLVLDEPPTRGEIDRRLAQLEQAARERGSALGLAGGATPVVIERLAAWASGLDRRGLALAPVSALIRRPDIATAAGEPGPRTR